MIISYDEENVNYQIYWNSVKYYCHNDINNDFMLEHFAALHKKRFHCEIICVKHNRNIHCMFFQVKM